MTTTLKDGGTAASAVGTVLFSRNEERNEADADSDIWDDSALIKAYDRAMTKMKGLEDPDTSDNPKPKDSHRKKHKTKKNKQRNWRVGDYCRVTFTEDGNVYAAQILSIDEQTQMCRVRYMEYNNEEDHSISELRHARMRKNTQPSQSGSTTNDVNGVPEPSSHGPSQHAPNHGRHGPGGHSMPPPPGVGHMPRMPFNWPGVPTSPRSAPFIPPPPPPITALGEPDMTAEDSEAMCSMLMAWYMSGYHTGYYQGLRDGRKQAGQSPYHGPT